MGRDLLTRPYGRFFYLAQYLAKKGHDVNIMLLNYKNEKQQSIVLADIKWTSISIYNSFGLAYYREINRLVKTLQPDWIIGFSDTYYGILANWLGKKYNIPSLIDAYDNYESYIPWLKPLHFMWRRALANADILTAAGPNLAELIGQYNTKKHAHIIQMAPDPHFYNQLNKQECRAKFDLPANKLLVGYSGAINRNRGIKQLFDAIKILKSKHTDIELVLSGRLDPMITLPPNVIWLGYLNDEDIPCLLKSMDTIVAINMDSKFGNYSYPIKLYEAMINNIPVVSTSTPATQWILSDHPEQLAPLNNPLALSKTIETALSKNSINYKNISSWSSVADKFEKLLMN